jgi:hypothetical protein
MHILWAAIIAAVLGGCAGRSEYLMSNYSGSPVSLFQAEGTHWIVLDKPDKEGEQSKIAVLPDSMKTTTSTLPQQSYERAATAYLAKTGRTCRINRSSLVGSQTWEFLYDCHGRSVAANAAARKQ